MKKSRGQGRKNRPTPKRVKPVKKSLSALNFEHPTVMHARYELELVGEDPRVIDWYCSVLAKWAELGHSGSSAELTADVLHRLMKGENLAPSDGGSFGVGRPFRYFGIPSLAESPELTDILNGRWRYCDPLHRIARRKGDGR
jgi:hypothetical protein